MRTLDYQQHKSLYQNLKGKESQMLDVDFSSNPETMRSYYLDMYDGVHADVVYTNRFDESSDLGGREISHIRTGQKWSICGCTVCDTGNYRCSWLQN